jgi:serine/threonine-protein kinase
VALKILAPALADDEAFRQRFIRESRAAAAVDDPHIIPVFEAGEASGVLFIAMRYVRGGDVGTLVRRLGTLQPGRMAGIVSQVASALDAAHARGLVHRDVKPTNMLLDASGGAGRPDHVYLSDFGLSKTSLQVSGLTATGQFLGTLEYVAPEQIESKPVDGRADQYALACAAYELLTGVPPFQRDSAMAMIFAQLSDPPPPLTGHRPDLPGQLNAVLVKALAKAPENRYRTCTEFAEALRSASGLPPYDTGPGAAPRPEHPATTVAPVSGQLSGRAETVAGPPSAGPAPAADPAPSPRTPADGTVVVAPASPVTPPAVDVRPRRTVAPPPADPPLTERLTAAGPAEGQRRRRTGLMAGAVALVAVVAAVVLVKLATGGHPGTGPTKGPSSSGSSSSSTQVTSGCASPAGGAPANPGFGGYQRGPTLTDTGSGHTVVEGAAFSPDSSMLAVGDHDGVTYLWKTSSASQITTFPDPTGSGVQAVAFSCTGTSVAVSDAAGSTQLWDIAHPSAPSSTIPDPGGAQVVVYGVALSPNGAMLATGDSNGNAYLRNLRTGHTITLPNPGGQGNKVQAVAFSSGGATVATGDSNGSTYLWNTATGQLVGQPLQDSNPGGNGVQAVAFSPDGSKIAAGDANGTTYLWDTSTGGSAGTVTDANAGGDGVVAVAYSPDGGTLATGDSNGDTYLWNTATDQNARTLPGPSSGGFGVQALAFSPNGQMLAVGNVNGRTYLWQR